MQPATSTHALQPPLRLPVKRVRVTTVLLLLGTAFAPTALVLAMVVSHPQIDLFSVLAAVTASLSHLDPTPARMLGAATLLATVLVPAALWFRRRVIVTAAFFATAVFLFPFIWLLGTLGFMD